MKSNTNAPGGRASFFVSLATFVLGLVILKAGQDVMVPIAIAGVLALLLSPVVAGMRRLGLGRIPAVALTATLAFALLACVAWLVVSQTVDLLKELPKYETNIDVKLGKLSAFQESLGFRRLAEMTSRVERELIVPPSVAAHGDAPLRVTVEPLAATPLAALQQLAPPVVAPLAAAGLVIVLVIAILLQRDDIRIRFMRLVDPEREGMVGRLIDDAERRILRYLVTELIVNACFGAFVGLGLYFIHIPNVFVWSVLAMFLRFIPYLGPWLAAAFPMVVAVAIDPSWFQPVATLGLYVTAESVTANAIEPLVYGARTGVSGLALLLAAVFWTWLWGLPGLFLSAPLTVCLMVAGNYVPELRFLSVLLGGRSAQGPVTAAPIKD